MMESQGEPKAHEVTFEEQPNTDVQNDHQTTALVRSATTATVSRNRNTKPRVPPPKPELGRSLGRVNFGARKARVFPAPANDLSENDSVKAFKMSRSRSSGNLAEMPLRALLESSPPEKKESRSSHRRTNSDSGSFIIPSIEEPSSDFLTESASDREDHRSVSLDALNDRFHTLSASVRKKAEIKGFLKKRTLFTRFSVSFFAVCDGCLFEYVDEGMEVLKHQISLSEHVLYDASYALGKPHCLGIASGTDANDDHKFLGIGSHQEGSSAIFQEWMSILKKYARFKSVGDAVILEKYPRVGSDEKGIVTSFNKAGESLFGYPSSQVIGENVTMLMPARHAEHHHVYMSRYLTSGQRRLIGKPRDMRIVTKAGVFVPVTLCVVEHMRENSKEKFAAYLKDLRFRHEEIARNTRDSFGLMFDGFRHQLNSLVENQLCSVENECRRLQEQNRALQEQVLKLAAELHEAQNGKDKIQHTPKKKKSTHAKTRSRSQSSVTPAMKYPVVDTHNLVVNEKIAEGGSGAKVYIATVSGWGCVMKELVFGEHIDQEQKDALLREISLLEALPYHPNICRYLYHEVQDKRIRMFTTRYNGSLEEKISQMKAKGQSFSAQKVAKLFLDLVFGLQFLHEHKIIHRDLKCDNIFFLLASSSSLQHSEIQSLAIGDFDSAKTLAAERSRPVTCIGTAGYMAPEVLTAKHTGEYDMSVDIFSLGMILFEMIALERPYSHVSALQVNETIIRGERPRLPENLDKSFKPLVNIFTKCTKLKPKNRPTIQQIRAMIMEMF